MEHDRTQKQQYLRTQIIDQSLNPNQFQQFMEQQKQEGSNIDNWTLDQLKQIVKLFKSTHQQDSISYSIKLEPNLNLVADLGDCEFQIQLLEHNQNKSKLALFTSNDSDLYQISTKPYNWKVVRSFKDFKLLVQHLKQSYPGFYVPVLPKKLSAKKPYHLQKKNIKLEYFCKNLKKYPELFFNPLVIQFFRNPDQQQFEQQIKQQLQNKVNSYKQIQLVKNELTIEANKNKADYIEYSQQYLDNSCSIYKAIKDNVKQLLVDLGQIQNTVQTLQNNFAMMFQIDNDFNSRLCMEQDNGLREIYVRTNGFMENIYSQNKKNMETISTKINSFINSQYKEIAQLQEMVKYYNTLQYEYKRQQIKDKNEKQINEFNELQTKFCFYQDNTFATLKQYQDIKKYNYHNLVFQYLLDLKSQNQEQNSQYDEFIKYISCKE